MLLSPDWLPVVLPLPGTEKDGRAHRPKKEDIAQRKTHTCKRTSLRKSGCAGAGVRGGRRPRGGAAPAPKRRQDPHPRPEDEKRLFDAFDASFKDDRDAVPRFIPLQRKKPYECSECGRLFKHKTDHIRRQSVHTGEKPCQRDRCGKAFRHSSDVRKHQRVHRRKALPLRLESPDTSEAPHRRETIGTRGMWEASAIGNGTAEEALSGGAVRSAPPAAASAGSGVHAGAGPSERKRRTSAARFPFGEVPGAGTRTDAGRVEM